MSPVNNPLDAGLHRRLVDHEHDLNTAAWNRARAAGDIIGACRHSCPGLLVPLRHTDDDITVDPHRGSTITWYDAACLRCGHEVTLPGGRALARSSRHGEMPSGWWEKRYSRLRSTAGRAA